MISNFTRESTANCSKCGLQYKSSLSICPHCVGKSNDQIIRDIHIPRNKQMAKNSSIGRQFIYAAIIIGCFLLLMI